MGQKFVEFKRMGEDSGERLRAKMEMPFDFTDPESCEAHAEKIESELQERPVTYFGRALVKDLLGRALELRKAELEKSSGNEELRDKVATLSERVIIADNLLAAAQFGIIK